MSRIAVVTGASAGIGAATASVLKSAGFDLVLGARREDRLRQVGEPLGARWAPLDVTDAASVRRFAEFAGPAAPIHLAGPEGVRVTTTLGELLPLAFGPGTLGSRRPDGASGA